MADRANEQSRAIPDPFFEDHLPSKGRTLTSIPIGAFGTPQTNNAFGAKPGGFGTPAATTGSSLFGGGTATSGSTFGGFGNSNNTTTQSTGFGASNTGGLFGAKPASTGFGAATTGFGAQATTGFGSGGTGFGAPASSALSANNAECQGTGAVPFAETKEMEPNSSTKQQNAFQSITFQLPYQKFSPEELRLADYQQGRKHGNASNQPGAFGSSTTFGGFGNNATQNTNTGFGGATNTGGGLFGGGATNTGFGATPATTGFGANNNTTGGLFGQAKPATGGLFGAQPQAQATGGLFGQTSTNTGFGSTSTGFGANNNATTGSSLFGANNAAKPPAFSFNTNQPASTGTGFGSTAATTGFGGGLFGNTQPQATTGFGAQQQQQPATNAFGTGFGQNAAQTNTNNTSLFGQKPATGGLFGQTQPAATGGGGLFGQTQPAATNAFGGGNTGGLFGQQKPATGGLFGQTNTTNTGGGGLFGNLGQSQPQTQTNSLFGGLNNPTQPKPSLFGSVQPQQQTGGLFGNTTPQAQQNTGGLFGSFLLGNNNQQQQQPQQIGSLFGGSNASALSNSQQNQQQQNFHTSTLTDPNAFGGIFGGLAQTNIPNPGPLATPIYTPKPRKTNPLPMNKLQPASSSRFGTPARGGFGFTYGNSPGSAASASSTPGSLSRGFLGSTNYNRGLSKSISTSSLRRSFNFEDSILSPGAFAPSPSARQYGSTGNMKKLVINKGIRSDLFNPPSPQQTTPAQVTPKQPPKVTFEERNKENAGGAVNGTSRQSTSPLKQTQNSANPGPSNGTPEMQQVTGQELARIGEDDASISATPTQITHGLDAPPGEYYMKPSKQEIEGMNRMQRQKIVGFEVGRENVGKIVFDQPVDLTDPNASLDTLFTETIVLETRTATVYAKAGKKAQPGKGLNVPSTITLYNSWPRKNGKGIRRSTKEALEKHIMNLKKVKDTEFVSYEPIKGQWIFRVPHYTTYGYDADSDEEPSQFGNSTLSAPPDTPTPNKRTPKSHEEFEQSFASTSEVTQTESDPEDTFQFRKKRALPLPGAFDDQEVYEDEYEDQEMAEDHFDDQRSFLDERSVGSRSENGVDEPMDQDDVFEDDGSVSIVDQEMAGSFPQADNTAELDYSQDEEDSDLLLNTPGAMVRARLQAAKGTGTPVKSGFAAGNNWASTLKTTISPQKQDRALLKSMIDIHGNDTRPDGEPTPAPARSRVVSDGRGFANSIDLMNSLFGQTRSPVKPKVPAAAKGFEWPYAKRSKTNDHDEFMSDNDRAFHDTMKPSWGPEGTLVYSAVSNAKSFGRSSARRARERNGLLNVQKGFIYGEGRDVHFAKFSNEAAAGALKKHQQMMVIDVADSVPFATLPRDYKFTDFIDNPGARDAASVHEKLVWELASVLFDDIVVPDELKHITNVELRLRKDKLSDFWQKLVDPACTQQVAMTRSNEEKAVASLSGHRVADACGHLLDGNDFHLATLVALIGKDSNRKDVREQLADWRKQRVLAEFTQPIRALYEILAGNVCVYDGEKGTNEDRIESFIISQRFGMDWRQAFGLRLWYGILAGDDLGVAVKAFARDIKQDRETSKPQAWYMEQKIPVLWEDKQAEERQDLLWGLLRLYAFNDSNLEAILRPENSQLSPVDIRLSWQLSRALLASGEVDYQDDSISDSNTKADLITLSFAAQLVNEGCWLDAVFVLLHLYSPQARSKAIQDVLAQQAGHIGTSDSPSFATLTQTYKIPTSWIWEAKALYFRSVKKDPIAEVECLLRAGTYDEAHRTFARDVAPKTIIERDYDTLRSLLHGFQGKEDSIAEWHLGGEIYGDFLHLLDSQKKATKVDHNVLNRLLAGLPAVVEEARHPSFLERVAVECISGIVAQAVVEMGEKADFAKVLRLPLTEDKYLKHTIDLSIGYYRDVMAGAR